MQNPKIWIPIIILLTIGVLYKNYSPNKDFDTFFDKFYIDQNLQLKSVKFPLKHIKSNKNIFYSTKEDWIKLGYYNLVADSRGILQENLHKDYIAKDSVHVTFKIDIDEIHGRIIYKFKKNNNNWFLIEVEDKSRK